VGLQELVTLVMESAQIQSENPDKITILKLNVDENPSWR